MRPAYLQSRRVRTWARRALGVYAVFLLVCFVAIVAASYTAGLPQ